jgi:hypothetical protein
MFMFPDKVNISKHPFSKIYFEGDTVYICGGRDHEAECYLNGKQRVH